jgi:hypothetical protein
MMGKLRNNQKGFGTVEIILIVVIVALIGVVGWFVYKNHNKTTPSTTNTTSTTPTTSTPTTTKQPSQESDTTTVVIKELGISFTGPNTLKDLTYTYRTNKTDDGKNMWIADLSSKSLTSFDKGCASDGVAPPLGNIAKVEGQYPANPTSTNSAGPLIKQFSTYYIGGTGGPQAACSDKDYPQNLQTETTQLRSDLEKALATVKAI